MEWKFSGSKPVYQQIEQILQTAVLAGEFAPGQRVPSVRDLAAQARVNPNTVQRAYAELEQAGILICGGTMGRCVTQDPSVLKALREQVIREAVAQTAEQFRALGIPIREAAALLMQMEETEDA